MPKWPDEEAMGDMGLLLDGYDGRPFRITSFDDIPTNPESLDRSLSSLDDVCCAEDDDDDEPGKGVEPANALLTATIASRSLSFSDTFLVFPDVPPALFLLFRPNSEKADVDEEATAFDCRGGCCSEASYRCW